MNLAAIPIIYVIHAIFYTVIALCILVGGGNWACQMLFSLGGFKEAAVANEGTNLRAGRLIGGLERLLIAIGLLAHSWEMLVAVIAIKTTARFKELDDKISAEYFLIGSLFSIIWAFLITGGWIAYDHRMGIDIRAHVEATLSIGKAD